MYMGSWFLELDIICSGQKRRLYKDQSYERRDDQYYSVVDLIRASVMTVNKTRIRGHAQKNSVVYEFWGGTTNIL